MEPYSLLILFVAMVVVWWFTWAPWRAKSRDESSQSQDADGSHGADDRAP